MVSLDILLVVSLHDASAPACRDVCGAGRISNGIHLVKSSPVHKAGELVKFADFVMLGDITHADLYPHTFRELSIV